MLTISFWSFRFPQDAVHPGGGRRDATHPTTGPRQLCSRSRRFVSLDLIGSGSKNLTNEDFYSSLVDLLVPSINIARLAVSDAGSDARRDHISHVRLTSPMPSPSRRPLLITDSIQTSVGPQHRHEHLRDGAQGFLAGSIRHICLLVPTLPAHSVAWTRPSASLPHLHHP